jgi:hypothetical protein
MDADTVNSLKNRRVLLEKEVDRLKAEAARLYLLHINGEYHPDEYNVAIKMLSSRQTELTMVNSFLVKY